MWQGVAKCGKEWQGKVGCFTVSQGISKCGKARHGLTWCIKTSVKGSKKACKSTKI